MPDTIVTWYLLFNVRPCPNAEFKICVSCGSGRFLMQIGLVRAEDQQRELFSGGQPEPEASSAQQKKAE